MSGYSCAIAAKRSSQNGIVIEMPFDLVAEVTCFLPRARKLEGVAQDAVDTVAGEERSPGSPFLARSLEETAAELRVFAFGVFAHDPEVDIAGLHDPSGAATRQQSHRTKIDIWWNSRRIGISNPERNVIGHPG